jgi:hypothetical protein
MHSLSARCIAVVTFALAPLAAHAAIFQFNAQLNAASEVPILANPTAATGVATLVMTITALSLTDVRTTSRCRRSDDRRHGRRHGRISFPHPRRGNTAGRASAHRARRTLFTNLNAGSTLLVGGTDVAATDIPATPASATNAGHPAMSFLQMLQSQLAYVNVHTALHPGGAIRGQLIEVTAVPEPETYAMLLAGLGFLAFMARRRMR